MFSLKLDSWSADFRNLIDSVENIHVQHGKNPEDEDDDPWLSKSLDNRLQIYFDGINDFLMIQKAAADIEGLRLANTMTIQIWAMSTVPDVTSATLLSKID